MTRLLASLLIISSYCLIGCGGGKDGGDKNKSAIKIAFVTNNPSDFWMLAKAGVLKAEKDFGVSCEFRMPAKDDAALQQLIIEDLMTKGVGGMAISPINSKNQTPLLNRASERMNVVCHDSDAPESKRLAYIGSNNVAAGRLAGELIKEALPDGGKVMLFVGSIDAQNARERKQGIEEVLNGTNIEIVGVLTDGTDQQKAQNNVTDTITSKPEVTCFAGLWGYNGPAIADAVKKARKVGSIKVVAFDAEAATLAAIKEGSILGTVVQDPYMFGYESVRILAALARKEDAKIPENKLIETPLQQLRKDNVDAFIKLTEDRVKAAKAAK